MLIIAALILTIIGFFHSYLGEKYILIRLFRRENLPKLFGDDWFTKRVLRFAWHLTTLCWWGFAGILLVLSNSESIVHRDVFLIIAAVFALSGLLSFGFSRGKHLSWLFFFIVAIIAAYSGLS